jgi:hypothetical protein
MPQATYADFRAETRNILNRLEVYADRTRSEFAMNNLSKSEVPISEDDRAEIVALYIELLRERNRVAQSLVENLELPFHPPARNLQDLRSEWDIP